MTASNAGTDPALAELVGQLEALAPEHTGTRYYGAVRDARAGHLAESRETLVELAAEPVLVGVPREYVHYDLAMILSRLGDLAQARSHYEAAVRCARPALHEHIYLAGAAEITMALGDLEGAVVGYRRALQANPSYVHALFGMAMALERQGNREDARGYLLEGLLADPGGRRFLADSTVFVPAADRLFAAGLIAEELGDHAAATEHFTSFAQADAGPFTGAGSEALSRVRAAGPAVLAMGPLPISTVSLAVADPRGRFVALAGPEGQLLLVDLAAKRVVAAPNLSGPAIRAMAFSGDTLLVADDLGDVTPFDTRGAVKRGVSRGPVALAGGTRVLGMSSDGEMLVVSDPSARAVQLADTADLAAVPGKMTISAGSPSVVAVGPWSRDRGSLFTAVWTTSRNLELLYGPSGATSQIIVVPNPQGGSSSTAWDAVTMSPDGRRIILAGRRYMAVCRAADGKIIRLLDVGAGQELGRVTAVVVDAKGAAGHGPAVLTLHERGYRAVRLDLFE